MKEGAEFPVGIFKLHTSLSLPLRFLNAFWAGGWGHGFLETPCHDGSQLLLLIGIWHPSGEKGTGG